MSRRDWLPIALACPLAALMLWLAGAPLARVAAPAELVLLVPWGDVRAFPRRFEWSEATGASLYEVSVAPAVEGADPLFRQRGPSSVLDLSFDNGAEPPPGRYVWEVLALREGRTIARGAGSFRVLDRP
jgi:hypothetical protein